MMVRQRPRKTYISALQRAEKQTEVVEDGEGEHKRRRYRPPRPRFSDLFVKRENKEGKSSKENVIPLQTEGKMEGSFEQSQTSQTFRRLLTDINSSTTTSVPSFNDTFDKVFGRTSFAAKPQVPLKNPCYSSSSESHLEGSGPLFKSLMSNASSLVADKSVGMGRSPTNNNNDAQTQKNGKRMAGCNNNYNNYKKTLSKEETKPLVRSPELFTSRDMLLQDRANEEDVDKIYEVCDSSPQSSPSSPPPAKVRTRRKQLPVYKRRTTSATRGAASSSHATKKKTKTDSSKAAPLTELPTSHSHPPSVQPSPLVQRFLSSQGIICPSPRQNIPTIPPQSKISVSPCLSEKLSSKSSIHTSTPTEDSRLLTTSWRGKQWSASASPSLEMKLSPVPREEDMVTDNSSVFRSPSLAVEVSREQLPGELRGSPTLPSKYETCTSSERLGQEVNSSTSSQEFVTGQTGDRGSRSPSYYNSSIQITHGPFKGARIPTLIFDSPPQEDTPPQQQDSPLQDSGSKANLLRLDTSEVSPVIKQRTRPQKGVKRMGKCSNNFSAKKSSKVTQRERKAPSWVAKRFSPTVTRSRSRFLGQLSDSSHNTDQSHLETTQDQNVKSAEKGLKRRSGNKGNVSGKKSKALAAQKTESTLDTDYDKESTMGSLPPLEELSVAEDTQPLRQTRRTSVISKGGNRGLSDLPPLPKRSMRLSRKLNPAGISGTKRSTKLSSLIHKSQESNITRKSRKVDQEEPSMQFSLSNFSSSPVKFQPRGRRRNNQFIFYRPNSSQSTTISSVNSSAGVSLSHPPSDTQNPDTSPSRHLAFHSSSQHPAGAVGKEAKELSLETSKQTTREEGAGTELESTWLSRVSGGGGDDEAGARECVFKQPFVLLRKLEESDQYSNTSNRSESVLPPLLPPPAIPAKPGKGWRRSIAIRARAASLNALEQVTDMLPPRTPIFSVPDSPRKASRLRIFSLPVELSPRLPPMEHTWLDSPRRSQLQMSFCSTTGEAAAPAPHDPRQQVLELCSQKELLPFTQCFTDSRLANCRKIGEGVYGEVFMTQPNPASLEGARVLKVMPIEGNFPVNGEPQKKFEEILSEMVISLELSGLRAADRELSITENFVHVQASWCVVGAYPQDLLHLWDLYHEEKGSENDRPDIFPDTQLYVVLEFGHGGRDLESFVFNNARDLMGVFLQIAYSLAVAEEALEFEHRDLHWGNVLVAPTSEAKINFKLSGETFTLNTYGLKATVIDFTLSRIKLPKCIVFNNLAEDPSLFTSEGDYQFEVYRLMQRTNSNDWEAFKPYTNVLWLHYLLVKMTSECYIKNANTKVHRTHLAQLSRMKDTMLDYESASHFLLSREE